MPHIAAQQFHDGTLLDNLAQSYGEHFDDMGLQMPFGGVGATLVIFWASICAGSEAVLFVLSAIAAHYNQRGVNVAFRHRFSCEGNERKQQWMRDSFSELSIEQGCIFQIKDLCRATAYCGKHGK